MKSLKEWSANGDYLPEPLKDFHDQKRVFKRIDELLQTRVAEYKRENSGFEPPESAVSWVAGHIYVIDLFLWFMAQHGWTLQRVRSPKANRPGFCDLGETIRDYEKRQLEKYMEE
jgi:hypothetical protein